MRRLVANRLAGGVLLAWLPLTLLAESNSAIEACTQLSDDQARLACFDREVAAQKAREGRHSQPSAAAPAHAVAAPAPAAAAPQLTEEQKMGLTPARIQQLEKPPGAPPPLKELTVSVQSISVDGNGHQVFTLDNGQIWRQVELDGSFSVRPGDSVLISRGVSNSYFMSFGKHRNTRVSRVH